VEAGVAFRCKKGSRQKKRRRRKKPWASKRREVAPGGEKDRGDQNMKLLTGMERSQGRDAEIVTDQRGRCSRRGRIGIYWGPD